MPDKLEKLPQTLKSLNNQTRKLDALYLSVPKFSKRLKTAYPELSQEIKSLATIVETDDYGPITKLVGALLMEKDPETIIITFDDDFVYPETIVSELVELGEKFPNTSLGSSGAILAPEFHRCVVKYNQQYHRLLPYSSAGTKIDCVFGYPGALYRRKFFPSKNKLYSKLLRYIELDDSVFINDDLLISGYLSNRGIERRVFHSMSRVREVLDEKTKKRLRNPSEISLDGALFATRFNRCFRILKEHGMYETTEPLPTENWALTTLWIIAAILLVLIFCCLLYLLR